MRNDWGARRAGGTWIEPLEDRTLASTTISLNWQRVADAPLTRSEGSKASVNGKLYTVGGFYNSALGVSKELDAYDPVANKWTRLEDMPVPETHGATAVYGNDFFVGGMFYNNGVTASNLVYMYDTVGNKWTQEPSLPAGRGAAGMAILGSILHVWGGLTGQTISAADHWALDLNNISAGWKTLAPLPQALDHVGSVALNGKLWSIGGFKDKNETSGNQTVVYRYDPASNKWSQDVAQLPIGLGHIGPDTIVAGDKIVIAGGQINASFEDEITSVFEYDPASNKWNNMSALPGPRKSAFTGFADGKLIVTGGNQPTAPYASNITWTANFNPGGAAPVSGKVFNDANADGKIGTGEAGLGGRTIYADLNNNQKKDANEPSVTTGSDGSYTFNNLPLRAVILRQILLSGEKQTYPLIGYGQHLTVGSSPITGVNFGAQSTKPASVFVAGMVFNDLNGNGKQDSGEGGLSGWRVYIDLNNNGMWDSNEPSTLTGSDGMFEFSEAAGTYIFRAIGPTGWKQTLPTLNYGQHVTLGAGGSSTNLRFGEHKT